MSKLRCIWKKLRSLWRSSDNLSSGIDSHKWESKVEIFKNLSAKQY